ncbi:MAG: zinc ribbon domain-containing protein [Kiritimatiellae bacterium]|nr:zinc ribbon domain-containing protein [Kiritimatiellia bacterium]
MTKPSNCPLCGAELNEGSTVCDFCGLPVVTETIDTKWTEGVSAPMPPALHTGVASSVDQSFSPRVADRSLGPPKTSPAAGLSSCCAGCGASLSPGARFCPSCGNPIAVIIATAGINCVFCGRSVKAASKFCSECGRPVERKDRPQICSQCGQPIKTGAKFCGACGAPVAGGKGKE